MGRSFKNSERVAKLMLKQYRTETAPEININKQQ